MMLRKRFTSRCMIATQHFRFYDADSPADLLTKLYHFVTAGICFHLLNLLE